jgi:hypothetical protein
MLEYIRSRLHWLQGWVVYFTYYDWAFIYSTYLVPRRIGGVGFCGSKNAVRIFNCLLLGPQNSFFFTDQHLSLNLVE